MIHLPSGRVYIGQRKVPKGVTPENDSYHGSGRIWRRIYKKHPDECVKVIIDYADTRDEIDELEKKYIKHYKEVYGELCVNIGEGGQCHCGWSQKDDVKKRISQSLKGRKKKPFTDEHRRRLSEAHKGRPCWCKGKKLSEETCRKISENRKGKGGYKMPEEAKEKIRLAAKLQHARMTPEEKEEMKRKIAEGQRRMSPEEKEEMKRKIAETKRSMTPERKQQWRQRMLEAKRSMTPEEKDEWRRKISEAKKGKPGRKLSEEEIRKLNEARKKSKWWEKLTPERKQEIVQKRLETRKRKKGLE